MYLPESSFSKNPLAGASGLVLMSVPAESIVRNIVLFGKCQYHIVYISQNCSPESCHYFCFWFQLCLCFVFIASVVVFVGLYGCFAVVCFGELIFVC